MLHIREKAQTDDKMKGTLPSLSISLSHLSLRVTPAAIQIRAGFKFLVFIPFFGGGGVFPFASTYQNKKQKERKRELCYGLLT